MGTGGPAEGAGESGAAVEESDSGRKGRPKSAGPGGASIGGEAEVALEVAPAAVDVVGGVAGRVGLDVEELDHEGGPLDAVGVRLAGLGAAGEGEVDLV